MKSIYDRVDEILPKITESYFRENKGLGNEVGFYIFDYDPKYEMYIRENIKSIKYVRKLYKTIYGGRI